MYRDRVGQSNGGMDATCGHFYEPLIYFAPMLTKELSTVARGLALLHRVDASGACARAAGRCPLVVHSTESGLPQ